VKYRKAAADVAKPKGIPKGASPWPPEASEATNFAALRLFFRDLALTLARFTRLR